MTSSKILTAAACLALVAGCTETGTLRIDGQLSESSAALTTPGSGRLELGGGALVLTRARLAVSEIELEGGSEDEEREAEMGAAVIDIELGGAPTNVRVEEVEAGAYHTLGIELHVADFDLMLAVGPRGGEFLDFARGEPASILVDGSYQGEQFELRSKLSPEAEFWLRPEVNVPANGEATVAIVFDVASWFENADGSVIDPRNRENQAAIDGKIMASIAARATIEGPDDD
jgi:hypothetical protein